ncbi:MAG: hypothetical protein JXX14_12765 [Deltaproteobacteria bacterium]|nr:hypothetical protein [Deltaproteobacteria bacterium]
MKCRIRIVIFAFAAFSWPCCGSGSGDGNEPHLAEPLDMPYPAQHVPAEAQLNPQNGTPRRIVEPNNGPDPIGDSSAGSLFPVLTAPQRLSVPGFNDASFVTPSTESNTPMPVVIVLHGNFDRPEWQCEMWRDVASWYGWVLCPRGVRTPYATLEEDRWTYRGGAGQVSKEMNAALIALQNRFPGAISLEGTVLVGFSLGAILLPEIVQLQPGEFETVFIIEGGIKQMERYLQGMKRNGVNRIGLAMSTPANRSKIPVLQKRIKKTGIISVYVDMGGAGHNYRSDFDETGNEALHRLLDDCAGSPK